MLKDVVNQFEKIYIATGYTDLRQGIDGLATTIHQEFELDPYNKDILFLFCGRRSDRIKGLLWEGDGFLLLYKRVESGRYIRSSISMFVKKKCTKIFRGILALKSADALFFAVFLLFLPSYN